MKYKIRIEAEIEAGRTKLALKTRIKDALDISGLDFENLDIQIFENLSEEESIEESILESKPEESE